MHRGYPLAVGGELNAAHTPRRRRRQCIPDSSASFNVEEMDVRARTDSYNQAVG